MLKELWGQAAHCDLIWLLQETLKSPEGVAKDAGTNADAAAGADEMEEEAVENAMQLTNAVQADDAVVQAGDTEMYEVRAPLCITLGQGLQIVGIRAQHVHCGHVNPCAGHSGGKYTFL